MGISFKTRIILWGHSGGKCFLCRQDLIVEDDSVPALIGDIAHIVAEHNDGPRGNPLLAPEEKNSPENLLLLCKNCHKKIDDQILKYSVDELKKIKSSHLEWIKKSLSASDIQKQKDTEIYVTYIEDWEKLVHLSERNAWTSWVLGPNVELWKRVEKDLQETRRWIFSRIWPKRHTSLEKSFENFSCVLHDFLEVFHEHSSSRSDLFETERFYKIPDWDEPRYKKLLDEYENHVALVTSLVMELTKAANHICEKVRELIAPWYRLKEGALIVEAGPFEDLKMRIYRPEYDFPEKSTDQPYPGLDAIKAERKTK